MFTHYKLVGWKSNKTALHNNQSLPSSLSWIKIKWLILRCSKIWPELMKVDERAALLHFPLTNQNQWSTWIPSTVHSEVGDKYKLHLHHGVYTSSFLENFYFVWPHWVSSFTTLPRDSVSAWWRGPITWPKSIPTTVAKAKRIGGVFHRRSYRGQRHGFTMATRAACLSPPELETLVESYQGVREQMKRNDNTPAFIEQREEM